MAAIIFFLTNVFTGDKVMRIADRLDNIQRDHIKRMGLVFGPWIIGKHRLVCAPKGTVLKVDRKPGYSSLVWFTDRAGKRHNLYEGFVA